MIKQLIHDAKLSWDKRGLESTLAQNITLMEGHKAADLPIGHGYYQVLATRSRLAIQHFCEKYQVPYDDVVVGVPQLKELEHMADGKSQPNKIVPVGIGIVMAIVAGTVTLAMCHNLYVYLTHWVR